MEEMKNHLPRGVVQMNINHSLSVTVIDSPTIIVLT